MELDTIIAQAQAVVDALTSYKATLPTSIPVPTVVEVDVKESDGSETITTPQGTPEATA